MATEDKNTFSQEQLDSLGVSPEVAAQFRTEIEAEWKKETDPAPAAAVPNADPTTPAAPVTDPTTASPVPPTVTGVEATPSEPTLEEQLAKEYPGGTVPIAALIAERKKRQELEKQYKPQPVAPAAPAPVASIIPVAAAPAVPAPAPVAPEPPKKIVVDSKRLVQEALTLWERNNPGEVFDAINPVHQAELMDNRAQVKAYYDGLQQQQDNEYQAAQQQQATQQRFQTEVIGAIQTKYGADMAAIDKFAGEMLSKDLREQYYVMGSLMQGNFQPMVEFYEKAAEKYRESITPKPIVKTDADKIDEINALPRSTFLPTGEKGKTRTMADIEKMISDGSWAKLPEAERESIINQIGGGAI